jgi:hypothetical protein
VAQQARDAGLLVGWYEYARPEFNGPEAEAQWFLANTPYQPGDVLVLDFEPPTIMPAYPAWAVAFGETVTAATGAPCWFYTNQYQGNAMVKLASPELRAKLFAMPLWKAYYQSAPGDLMGWPEIACWQWSASDGLDKNVFFGDAEKWRTLAVPEGNDMALTDADVAKILDTPIVRQPGNDPKVTTSLRAMAAWFDHVVSSGDKTTLDAVKALPTTEQIADAVADEQYQRQAE